MNEQPTPADWSAQTEWGMQHLRELDPEFAQRVEGAMIAMKRIQSENETQ